MSPHSLKLWLAGLFLLCIGNTYADQLQWLSKENAEKAAAYIRKQSDVFLFCGCCDGDHYRKIHPAEVTVRPTGTENYYEVVVTWTNRENSASLSEPLDMAYVWVQKKKKWYTVGQELHLEHDPCKQPVK